MTDPAAKAAIDKQIDDWHKTAARYESDPKTGDGRKELAERAKDAEEERDLALAHYHHYELASAAFQIGIVLASAAVITGMVALAWFAGVLGVVGLHLMALGLFAPHAVPLSRRCSSAHHLRCIKIDRALVDRQRRFLDGLASTSDGRGRCGRCPPTTAPNSMAMAASAIMVPASGPRMCTPSTRSVLASARILTKPSVARLAGRGRWR